MTNLDNFLQDIFGNIVGNTLTDHQKMELLETLFRMMIELHAKLDRIEHNINRIEKEIKR